MSISFRAGGVRAGRRRSGAAAPTGRTERNVRQRRLRTFENEAEAQQRPGPSYVLRGRPWEFLRKTAPEGAMPGGGRRPRRPGSGTAEGAVGAEVHRSRPGVALEAGAL